VAVVTVPDKPQGRGQKLMPSPVKKAAMRNEIEVLQPASLQEPEFFNRLKEIDADVYVVVAFKILPKEIFALPENGAVNLHASLLPKYRGAAPINWAIIKGEQETGVTTILIDENVDTGNMLLQKKVSIEEDMTAGQLHDILADVGAGILIETLDQMAEGSINITKQDNSQATKAPKLTKELCHIDFNQPAVNVYNLIRGLNPYPGAFAFHKGRQIKIYTCKPSMKNSGNSDPGTVIQKSKNDFTLSCRDGAIVVSEVQLEGKRRMTVREFFNGYSIETGDYFD